MRASLHFSEKQRERNEIAKPDKEDHDLLDLTRLLGVIEVFPDEALAVQLCGSSSGQAADFLKSESLRYSVHRHRS